METCALAIRVAGCARGAASRLRHRRRSASLELAARRRRHHARHAHRHTARLRDERRGPVNLAGPAGQSHEDGRGRPRCRLLHRLRRSNRTDRRKLCASAGRCADEVRRDSPHGRAALSRAHRDRVFAPPTSRGSPRAASSSPRSASRTASRSARISKCWIDTTSSARVTSVSFTTVTTIWRGRLSLAPSSAIPRTAIRASRRSAQKPSHA